ncbi:MAG TPA: pyridoxal-phosphate dependent enzyme [Cellulomonas sp.]
MSADRHWTQDAMATLHAERARSADTHLRPFPLPGSWGVDLYLKDESGQPTGSLKHRLARSLFTDAVIAGHIGPGTTVVEASSGSTAVSEAYFARLLGLPFLTVVPRGTSAAKIEEIHRYGGEHVEVDDAGGVGAAAVELAERCGGYFMDQFAHASEVTDWRDDNIASSILGQMRLERFPVPSWVVVGAGTGGTSATIGRYFRSRDLPTRVAVADPVGSAYFDAWVSGDPGVVGPGSRIEGVGRPRVEPAFMAGVVDAMFRVDDAASVAFVHLLRERTGIVAGGSTGTSLAGCLALASAMSAAGERGSIVTVVADSGDRYRDTYYDRAWLSARGIDLDAALADARAFLDRAEDGALPAGVERGEAGGHVPAAGGLAGVTS